MPPVTCPTPSSQFSFIPNSANLSYSSELHSEMGNRDCSQSPVLHHCHSFLFTLPCSIVASFPWATVLPELILPGSLTVFSCHKTSCFTAGCSSGPGCSCGVVHGLCILQASSLLHCGLLCGSMRKSAPHGAYELQGDILVLHRHLLGCRGLLLLTWSSSCLLPALTWVPARPFLFHFSHLSPRCCCAGVFPLLCLLS